MKSNYKRLGDYMRQVDVRNKDLGTSNLLGINIDKFFMPSVANIIGTDLRNYKLIREHQFACNPMHVGRDERIPVALYLDKDKAIVSPAYFVFEIVRNELLSQYLMLWFRRPEFDRECWFYTDASVRGGITWEDFCEMRIPVPPIEEQEKTVDAYQKIEKRIALKRKINDNLESQISTLYFNQKGDNSFVVSDRCRIFTGKKDVNQASSVGRYKFFSCSPFYLYSDDYIYDGKAVLVAGNGSYTGRTTFVDEKFDLYQRTYGIVPNDKNDDIIYLVYAAMSTEFIRKIKESLHGSAIPYIVYNDIAQFVIFYDNNPQVVCNKIGVLLNAIIKNNTEINALTNLQRTLLCRMSS